MNAPRFDLSLRARASGLLVLGIAFAILLVGSVLGWHRQRGLVHETEARALALAVVVGEACKSGLDFADADFVAGRLALLESSPDARVAAVYLADGSLLAAWGAAGSELPIAAADGPAPGAAAGVAQRVTESSAQRVSREQDLLWVTVPIVARAGTRGTLMVAFSTAELERAFRGELWVGLLLGLALWVAGSGLAWAFGSLLAEPLTQLTSIVGKSDVKALADALRQPEGARVFVHDERLLLSQAFEGLARRLADQVAVAEAERARALRAEDTALRASSAKSQFLANMSHELRTPLNVIIGYTEMLLETADESSDDLGRVLNASTHLLGLINDILDLAKIEAERMQLTREPFEVAAVVDDVIGAVRHLISEQGNTFQTDVAIDLGTMTSDAMRVRQCLLNLLSNAAKFTQDGSVRLAVRRVQDRLLFEVTDTGLGMTLEEVSRLFQPFSQVDTSSTRRFGGTGLGLVLTRRLCRAMGGDVWLSSEPGHGSTFTIELPDRVPDELQATPTHRGTPVPKRS